MAEILTLEVWEYLDSLGGEIFCAPRDHPVCEDVKISATKYDNEASDTMCTEQVFTIF